MAYPDKWSIIKQTHEDGEIWYRLFANFYGGYVNGDSWRINSGIDVVKEDDKSFTINGAKSNTIYMCNKKSYGITSYGMLVFSSLQSEVLDHGVKLEYLSDKEALEVLENIVRKQ